MNILNLYAGIGGNRKLWNANVTAIEMDETVANIYKDNFPDDNVIVADAKTFLLNHYSEFDFIWASPPCQSHSRVRYHAGFRAKNFPPVYPDMTLYQIILFLQYYYQGDYIVENVISFYPPLVKPQVVSRHFIWSNANIPDKSFPKMGYKKNNLKELSAFHGFDLSQYHLPYNRKLTLLRNCVYPPLGEYLLNTVCKGG